MIRTHLSLHLEQHVRNGKLSISPDGERFWQFQFQLQSLHPVAEAGCAAWHVSIRLDTQQTIDGIDLDFIARRLENLAMHIAAARAIPAVAGCSDEAPDLIFQGGEQWSLLFAPEAASANPYGVLVHFDGEMLESVEDLSDAEEL